MCVGDLEAGLAVPSVAGAVDLVDPHPSRPDQTIDVLGLLGDHASAIAATECKDTGRSSPGSINAVKWGKLRWSSDAPMYPALSHARRKLATIPPARRSA